MEKTNNPECFKKLMGFTDNEYINYIRKENYIENHWKLFCRISASTINGMNLIESKIDQLILNYYGITKDLEVDFIDKVLTKINFKNKYDTALKILEETLIQDTENLINKFSKVNSLRIYRNTIAHSFLEDNFNSINETDKRKRIKLRYYNSNTKRTDYLYVTIEEHEQKLKMMVAIYYSLKIYIIQTYNRIDYLEDNNSPMK